MKTGDVGEYIVQGFLESEEYAVAAGNALQPMIRKAFCSIKKEATVSMTLRGLQVIGTSKTKFRRQILLAIELSGGSCCAWLLIEPNI